MFDLQSLFPNSISPDSVSVYLGRVISLDSNFQDNGYLYVDLVDPNGTDLSKGEKTANRAKATYALRLCHNSWEKPPEIKSKTQFMGSMSMTTNGDFHLRNYCFDMQTLSWFMTVSTALNAIGIVNVPPVLVGLDTTPFPGQAVAVNVSLAAKEVVEEAIDNALKDIEPSSSSSDSNSNSSNKKSLLKSSGNTNTSDSGNVKPNLQIVKQKLTQKNNQSTSLRKAILRSSGLRDTNDVIADIINMIIDPLKGIVDKAFKPYYQFINCINLLFQIYEKQLDDIEEITWPITTFSNLASTVGNNSIADKLALKNKLRDKIKAFETSIENDLNLVPSDMLDVVYEVLYEPLAYMYQTVSDAIDDIVNPIKNKITGIIGTYVKEPLSNLISFISMAIQPAISALPSFIQVIVKWALKKLLNVLLGKPIEYILKKVVQPIEELIDKTVEEMKTKVVSTFADAIKTVIKPLVNPIQKAILEIIPSFDMGYIENKLEDIKEGVEEFPAIYVGKDPLHPYKQFKDIDWSNSEEVACMLHTLIQDFNLPPNWEPSEVELIELVESIQPTNRNRNNNSNTEENNNSSTEEVVKKFDSKEELMSLFEKAHPPVMESARLGEGMFAKYGYGEGKIKPEKWITNGVYYVMDDAGEKYVVAMDDNTEVSVFYPDSEEIGIVKLEKDFVYESEEVQHITEKNGKDTPVEGNDLVPVVTLEVGVLTPQKLEIQKMNDKGELLYVSGIGGEDTYDNLIKNYLADKIEVISLSALLDSTIPGTDLSYKEDLLDKIKQVSPPTPGQEEDYTNRIKEAVKQSSLYSLLTTTTNYNKKPEGIVITRNIIVGDDLTSVIITPSSFSFQNPSSGSLEEGLVVEYFPEDSQLLLHLYNDPKFDPIHGEIQSTLGETPDTDYINRVYYEIILTKQNSNDYNDFQFINCLEYWEKIKEENNPQPYWKVEYNWFTPDNSYDGNLPIPVFALSYTKQTKDTDSLYIKVEQKTEGSFNTVYSDDLSNPEKVEEGLQDMLVSAISAIGQDTPFDGDTYLDVIKRKTTSVFSPLADSVDGVSKTIDAVLENVEELKKIDSMMGTIQEVGSKIQEISDTAKPALEATAKAASAAAIQSCSMSQSATGKDFTFTSGSNYDLSTTTDSRQQLPYCKELNREHFLEPNCKVLVLAVGAGKQNLFVVDILS